MLPYQPAFAEVKLPFACVFPAAAPTFLAVVSPNFFSDFFGSPFFANFLVFSFSFAGVAWGLDFFFSGEGVGFGDVFFFGLGLGEVFGDGFGSRSPTESDEEYWSEVESRFSPAQSPIDFLPAERVFPVSEFLPVSANQPRRSYPRRRSAM